MRYLIIGASGLAMIVAAVVVLAVAVTSITADDPHPEVLSGTELTIEDWQECLAFLNESRERNGEPTTTTLPSLGADGEWHFAGAEGGEFYSCSGGRVIPTP